MTKSFKLVEFYSIGVIIRTRRRYLQYAGFLLFTLIDIKAIKIFMRMMCFPKMFFCKMIIVEAPLK